MVAEADLEVAQQWVQRHLVPTQPRETRPAELQVWACHGGLLRNGRGGRPLTIADQEYQRGLLAHAPSKLVVQLDSPGKVFSAIVGLDSNEATRPGLGSVVFSVTVGGKVVAQSPVLREGMQGVPLRIDLDGATSFVLEATDAGDGIASDHADWAAAKVVLADGTERWLSELPEASEGLDLPFSFVYGGTPSKWLLPAWERKDETRVLDENRLQRCTCLDRSEDRPGGSLHVGGVPRFSRGAMDDPLSQPGHGRYADPPGYPRRGCSKSRSRQEASLFSTAAGGILAHPTVSNPMRRHSGEMKASRLSRREAGRPKSSFLTTTWKCRAVV